MIFLGAAFSHVFPAKPNHQLKAEFGRHDFNTLFVNIKYATVRNKFISAAPQIEIQLMSILSLFWGPLLAVPFGYLKDKCRISLLAGPTCRSDQSSRYPSLMLFGGEKNTVGITIPAKKCILREKSA